MDRQELNTDVTTREFCGRCHRVSPIGFHARNDIWKVVAGRHWSNSILCIMCFAQLGDEKHVEWEEEIKFYAVSYATHHAGRGRHDASQMEVDRLRTEVEKLRELLTRAADHSLATRLYEDIMEALHGRS